MNKILFFLIGLFASVAGGISGIGGGVIIKPALDAFGGIDVSSAGFLSGVTVLSMAAVSALINKGGKQVLKTKLQICLAMGSAAGGIGGKMLFEIIKGRAASQNTVGIVQTLALIAVTAAIYIYMITKEKWPTYQLYRADICILTGIALGIISSFLGIGGGPLNVAVLAILFSMNAKEAATVSLFIILFSQSASLISTVVSDTIPDVKPPTVILMVVGGIIGGMTGRWISAQINKKTVEKIFTAVLLVILMISVYNLFQYVAR